jgi:hypothetical protein
MPGAPETLDCWNLETRCCPESAIDREGHSGVGGRGMERARKRVSMLHVAVASPTPRHEGKTRMDGLDGDRTDFSVELLHVLG